MDVLAVVENPADKQILHSIAFDVEVKFGVAISLIPRTTEEYERTKNTTFITEIIDEGETTIGDTTL